MHRILSGLAVLFMLVGGPARAADSTVSAMTAAGSVTGADLLYCVQSGGTLDRKCTSAQMAAYINSLVSGDCTATGTGTYTCRAAPLINFPPDTTATASMAAGTGSLANQTGSIGYSNTAFGYQVLAGALTSAAVNNAGFGTQAMQQITSGHNNNAFGWNALLNTTTGSFNDAFGHDAMNGNVGGSTNAAFGEGAMFGNFLTYSANNNAAFGGNALFSISTGGSNTALGENAFPLLTTGATNVGVGQNVAPNFTTGNNNVILGVGAAPTATAGASSNVVIGQGADVVQSNTNGATVVGTGAKGAGGTVAIGNGALGTGGGGFNVTVVGGSAGTKVTGGNNTIIGAAVGSTTLVGGTGNVLIGTSSAIDTPAAGTSNYLNIMGYLTATAASAITLPGYTSAGCLANSAAGLLTSVTCATAAANPTATAKDTANNGVATTWMRSDASPAIQKATAAQFGIVEVDGTTITAIGGVISAVGSGSGTVTSVAAGCGTSTGGSAITSSGTVTAAYGGRVNATTSDTLVAADCGTVVYESSSSNVAIAIAAAGTTGFGANTFFQVCDIAAGTTTITPTTSTIGGAATLVISAGSAAHPSCASFRSDGTNYTLLDVVPGTNVPAAMGVALSAAGGLTGTIANGTATIPATAVGSGACGTAVTVSAANVATTDVVAAGFAADPTATTGFLPTAMLTIVPYPTSGNVNFKACNLTASSITPTATTINWRVTR